MTTTRRGLLTAMAATPVIGLVGCDKGDAAATPSTNAKALASASSNSITLTGGWAVATTPMTSASPSMGGMSMSPMAAMSAAYGTLTNTGSSADALVKVTSPAAKDCQLHTTAQTSSGAGTMKHVDTIEMPAGKSVELKMGGFHIMLMQLTQTLTEGQPIDMTLNFASGTTLTATFPVYTREHRPGS